MAVSTAMAFFKGASGRGYVKDIYKIDTAEALDRWDGGNGASATSPDYWTPPENVILYQYIQTAATGQTRTSVDINYQPTGNMFRNASFIPSATIIGTPPLSILIPGGSKLSFRAIA